MISEFYANGKLLLTGEYLVLHGASALVLPLKFGQHMQVTQFENGCKPMIRWQANAINKLWFSANIEIHDWIINSTSDNDIASNLVTILRETERLNPAVFKQNTVFDIITNSDFDMNWGLGSSSSLIANISQWASIDPFELLFSVSNGSGADIAAAISPGPLLYRLIKHKPIFCSAEFKPAFSENLWLVYLEHKQDTAQSVNDFKHKNNVTSKQIGRIDGITEQIIQTKDFSEFICLIRDHEIILQDILGMRRIKEQKFNDFIGEIKSLGSWGGDFALAATEMDEKYVRNYFKKIGLETIFSFNEMVIQNGF